MDIAVWETFSGFGKSSLKHPTSFRVISSNQKLARVLPSTPKTIARTNLLSDFWDEHRGLRQFSEAGRRHPAVKRGARAQFLPKLSLNEVFNF